MASVSLGSTSLMFTCPRYRAASISASTRTARCRASGYIVGKSMMSRLVLTVLIAVAHQAGGDRVAVGLVADQDIAKMFAGRGAFR
jgi:hypothetical protein